MALSARAAEEKDLPALLELVDQMFAALGTLTTEEWRGQCMHDLAARLWHDVGIFVVDGAEPPQQPTLVACAVGIVHQSLPSPRRIGVTTGYVEWVATRSTHRRRGHARAANAALIDWLTEQGAAVVDVHSSAEAESLYRSLGFCQPGPTALRLRTRHYFAH